MKNLSAVLAALALAGVVVLFVLRGRDGKPAGSARQASVAPAVKGTAPSGRLAYVDIDSLENNYTYFKTKQADFKKRQDAIETELRRSAEQLQQQAAEFQKKAQSGGFTSQADGEAAQRRLGQMEQSLNTRRQTLADGLLKDQEAFNKDLKVRLDAFLEGYAQERGYDYVLSYSKTGSILFANPTLDVTKEVIAGMNDRLGTDDKK